MEEFRTYIFEKSKKRDGRRFSYILLSIAAFGVIILLFVFGSLLFGIVAMISIIILVINIKYHDDKSMGITAHGERKSPIVIAHDYFVIEKVKIPFSELDDLLIYVDEYAGKPREVFGLHHGGNNEIRFRHKGKKFSFNYIIKDKSDFQKVDKLVAEIEKRYGLAT